MAMNGPFVDGTTGVMYTPAGREHQVRLENVHPGQSFDLVTRAVPLTTFTFHCEVVPSSGGSTISQSLGMSGPLAVLFSPMAGDRIAASFEPLLEGLANKAEASEGAATEPSAPKAPDVG